MSDAVEKLEDFINRVTLCRAVLVGQLEFIDEYERERNLMESAGAVLAPQLFMSEERKKVDAKLWEMMKAVRALCNDR
jgi:hypothetical protein